MLDDLEEVKDWAKQNLEAPPAVGQGRGRGQGRGQFSPLPKTKTNPTIALKMASRLGALLQFVAFHPSLLGSGGTAIETWAKTPDRASLKCGENINVFGDATLQTQVEKQRQMN